MPSKLQAALEGMVARAPDDSRDQLRRDVEMLSGSGITTYKALFAAPADRALSTGVQLAACGALARVGGQQAVRVLLKTLDHEKPEVSFEAAKSLVTLGGKDAVPRIVAIMLKGREPHNRAAAAYSLGMLGDPRAVPGLIELLNGNDDAQVRSHAAEALGHIADRRAVDSLIAHLTDGSAEVRFWSVFALGEIGEPAAVPHLKRLASSDTATLPDLGSVSSEARDAIKRIRKK